MIRVLVASARVISFSVMGTTGFLYLLVMYTRSTSEFVPFGIGVFGISAALSGLCYAKASVLPEEQRGAFVLIGEKLMHSALLVSQSIVVKVAVDALSDWLQQRPFVELMINCIASVLFYSSGVLAFLMLLHACDDLNVSLWQRYVNRLKGGNDYWI